MQLPWDNKRLIGAIKHLPARLKPLPTRIKLWAKESINNRTKRRLIIWFFYAAISSIVAFAYVSLNISRLSEEGSHAISHAKRIVIDVPSGSLLHQESDDPTLVQPPEITEPTTPITPATIEPTEPVAAVAKPDPVDPFVQDIAESLDVTLGEAAEEETITLQQEFAAHSDAANQANNAENGAKQVLKSAPKSFDLRTDNTANDDSPNTVKLPAIEPNQFSHRVAIIVSQAGLRRDTTLQALGLPRGVTFAFSPYAPDLLYLTTKMAEKNRRYLLEIPMNDDNYPYNDPGPYGIINDAPLAQNLYRLQKLRELGTNTKGFFAPQGEVFTNDTQSAIPVLDSLRRNGAMLVLQKRDENEETRDQAYSIGLPHIAGYIALDDHASRTHIYQKMAEIRQHINENKGDLVIVIRSYPLSIAMINDLTTELTATGITLSSPYDLVVK